MKRYLYIFLLIPLGLYSQDLEIPIQDGRYIIDHQLKLIICNEDINSYLDEINVLTLVLDNQKFTFTEIPSSFNYSNNYAITCNNDIYQIYFSNFPIINITISEDIVNEPKKLATFKLSNPQDSSLIVSFCGIERRGGYSQSFPKKSYDLELWKNELGEKRKTSLLGMRDDDDWLLLAMYNEPLRIRNVFAHQLWKDLHKEQGLIRNSKGFYGINTHYIELSINNEYLGVYALTEQIDRKQLEVEKFDGLISGQIYKSVSWGEAVLFEELIPYNNNNVLWGGYEVKYPDDEIIIEWSYLYDFIDFIMNSTDVDFTQNINHRFDLVNAIDYFIFLNILRASDNRAKNIYLAKKNSSSPYFYTPWDLDGILGNNWKGLEANIYDDILDNRMYSRLINMDNHRFTASASNRWFELREDLLSEEHLVESILEPYNLLVSNAIYDREILKWGAEVYIPSSGIYVEKDISNDISYTLSWLNNRLKALDVYFDTIAPSIDELYFLYPNPIQSAFFIESNYLDVMQSYQIYDLRGVLLREGEIIYGQEINISGFKSGMYIIRIITDQEDYIYNSQGRFSTISNLKLIKQ